MPRVAYQLLAYIVSVARQFTVAAVMVWSSHPGRFTMRNRVKSRRMIKIKASVVIASCTPKSLTLRVVGSTKFDECVPGGSSGRNPWGVMNMAMELGADTLRQSIV